MKLSTVNGSSSPPPRGSSAIEIDAYRMPRGNTGPSGSVKHLSAAAAHGRLWFYGGDYYGHNGSYQRRIFSVGVDQDWRQEAPYCPPSASAPWPKGACQSAVVFDSKADSLALFAGNQQGRANGTYSGCSVPFSEMNTAFITQFSIPKVRYTNPRQQDSPYSLVTTTSQFKYGVYDPEGDRYLTSLHDGRVAIFDKLSASWILIQDALGIRYAWQQGFSVKDRGWYFIDEQGGAYSKNRPALVRYDLDGDRWEFVAVFPFATNPPGWPKGYEICSPVWWPEQGVFVVNRRGFVNDLVIIEPDRWKMREIKVAPPTRQSDGKVYDIRANSLAHNPADGTVMLIGRNDYPYGSKEYFDYSYFVLRAI